MADKTLQSPGSKPFDDYAHNIAIALRDFDKVGSQDKLATWLNPWVGLDSLLKVFQEADKFVTTYVNGRKDLFDVVASVRNAVDLLVQAASAAAAHTGRTEAEIRAAVDGALGPLYEPPSGASS